MNSFGHDLNSSDFRYANINISGVGCPVCDTVTGKLLYRVSCERAAQHFVLKEVNAERYRKLANHIAVLWNGQNAELIECDGCGFVYAFPYVGGDMDFYTLAYERSGYPKWKWEYQKTLDAIREISAKSEVSVLKFLEIGAGDGAFVKKVSPEFIAKENILCLEFSEYGRKQIQQYGISCRGEDIRSLDLDGLYGQFDIVCLFQVLEHMDRLNELFSRLNALGKKNSHLFITVPNNERIEFNETHGFLLDMPPNHIGRWNRLALEKIGRKHGWSVSAYFLEPSHLFELIKQMATYRYLKCSQDSSSFANRIERLHIRTLRNILRIFCAGIYMFLRPSLLLTAMLHKNRGDAQWVHFVKTE